jgi:hypothetical protein
MGNLAAGNQGGPGGYGSWNRVPQGRSIGPANSSHLSAIPRRDAPELCVNLVPPKTEGAGKAGCALHPRSRVQYVHKNTHTSIQVQRRHPAFPAQWFYGL